MVTDGAYNLGHLGLGDWPTIATYDDGQLATLLAVSTTGKTGRLLLWADPHDDKSVAVLRFR
ncbi:hypothetical protein Aglo03_64260 [Actinokineospora globicatena]|uniref:Uncharacterized protein n=1 Tax=Actinokineospora globicatena TaxID=103729 RepID=A0A9W6QSX0_9PSEU|nr:hypothetical protein Aglo03_64260 [Actinokineospora globicatena]